MQSVAHSAPNSTAEDTSAAAPARVRIYWSIHKTLRGFMLDTLARIGRMDVGDRCEMTEALEQAEALLELCLSHLHHENEFLHPALEKARPESSLHTADDHVDHLSNIAKLQTQIAALKTADERHRTFLADALYQQLTLFIADNFEHMHIEETRNQEVLVDAYSDREILDIQAALIATIPPAETALTWRWMLPYLNANERAQMLQGVRATAPQFVFDGVLQIARETLSERDWYKLERALQS